ncbi:dihydroorotase [Schaedlerella arabinosiphila]|uniref:Dihydroorotase n=1 Tax=Schaedlerella arabinosiphila TaxID=2044587 RepID=A0A9X5CDE7_9FIRM|nr:dihydroorotase [Schaedlerella arabinosiphila]KAI4440268.1 Dihydroorotase [Schaedlerella arabinosiphila]NDO72467.1 dihydroorotase [Schaedlerella arabinosiphila]
MIIKNGLIMDPHTNASYKADLRIQDGIIEEIGPTLSAAPTEECINTEGFIIAPGLIDTHTHFRDPGFTHKETLHTGALAAAGGGFTSVICMANTSPAVDSVPVLQDILERAEQEPIRIFQAGTVSHGLKGQVLTDMQSLKEAGACGFTDDGIPITNAAFCYEAMKAANMLDVPISLHEEDPAFIQNNGINHGKVSRQMGLYGSPAVAEESLVARDCMLALRSGAHVVIQHISSGYSVELVRTFRAMGAKLHAEATPHHFSLTEEALLSHGTLAKMNPPLRTEEDRQAIIQGLSDGTIDLIATDHAPHSAGEKAKPFPEAPSGIIGLETALSLGITSLVRPGHLTMMELLEKMTFNPAKLYHLPYGKIEQGAQADLMIFDPKERWIPDSYLSMSSNSPFTGKELYGKVKYTLCRGRIVYADPAVS